MHSPLVDCEDDTKVIDVMPPMELHLFTGVFNRIFDIGNEIIAKYPFGKKLLAFKDQTSIESVLMAINVVYF